MSDDSLKIEELPATHKHVFKVTAKQLQALFCQSEEQVNCDDILDALATNAESGIVGDKQDIQLRKQIFGENHLQQPAKVTFGSQLQLFYLQNQLVQILLIVSAVQLVISPWSNEPFKWLEILAVCGFTLVMAFVRSDQSRQQQSQTFRLTHKPARQYVVLRSGRSRELFLLNEDQLCAGDIIEVGTGDQVPCDCLIIESNGLEIDGKTVPVTNQFGRIYTDAIITGGFGKCVVCCVGNATFKYKSHKRKLAQQEGTALQADMTSIGKRLQFIREVAAITVFVGLSALWVLINVFSQTKTVFSFESLNRMLDNVLVGVCLCIQAQSKTFESLVTLTVANQHSRIQQDSIDLNSIQALENAAKVTDIIIGKTTMLSAGQMSPSTFLLGTVTQRVWAPEVSQPTWRLVQDVIMNNTLARIEMNDEDHRYEPQGSPIEVGMLNFLVDNGVAVQDLINQKQFLFKQQFCGNLSRMIVVYKLNERQVRVVVKGSPEAMAPLIVTFLDANNTLSVFDSESYLKTVADEITSLGQQAITYAFKDLELSAFMLLKEHSLQESLLSIEFTLAATFGLSDPLRDGAAEVVNQLRAANIKTRVLSGDHKDTVLHYTSQVGFTDEGVLSGQELRELLGSLMAKTDQGYKFVDEESKLTFMSEQINIVYRAGGEEKYMLLCALKEIGSTIGVTAFRSEDNSVLHHAHVGYGLGSGQTATKQQCGVVLTDNSLQALHSSVLWGRNLIQSQSRFLQFHTTMSLSCLLWVFIVGVCYGKSPFNPVQVLYITFVLDSLAAIVLTSEGPYERQLTEEKDFRVLTPFVARDIFVQVVYQVLVLIVLMIPATFGLDYELYLEPMRKESGRSTERQVHYTLLLVTFIWLNFCNMFNCRGIQTSTDRGINVIKGWYINLRLVVVALCLVVVQMQTASDGWFNRLVGVSEVSLAQQWATFTIGLGAILIATFVKLLPAQITITLFDTLWAKLSSGQKNKVKAFLDKKELKQSLLERPSQVRNE